MKRANKSIRATATKPQPFISDVTATLAPKRCAASLCPVTALGGRHAVKTLLSIALVMIVGASNAFGTAQYPDRIIYQGKKYSLHTNPMESYFHKHPGKRPKGGVMSTALWRGYVAIFDFKDTSLVLKDIKIQVRTESEDGKRGYMWKSAKDLVVPENQDLTIDWFTGILVLPYGDLVNYVHMGYGSTYANYILLEINGGKLTGERKLDHKQYEQFKDKQFEAFKKTTEYRELVAEMKKKGRSQQFIDSFLRSFVVKYTSKFLDK